MLSKKCLALRIGSYLARSQVTEAIHLIEGLKAPVVDIYGENGTCPANGSGGIPLPNQISGSYTARVDLSGTTSCVITATMASSNVSSMIAGLKVSITMIDPGNGRPIEPGFSG